MGIIFLPSEIYYREFDYKLSLATYLASLGHFVLCGYDKHFNNVIPAAPAGALLEKSASTFMYNARIKPAINNGGQAIVNDEEGFNNLHEEHQNQWLNRVDPRSIESIHSYLCWGEYDYSFFSKINRLKEKMIISGNCRRDLLEDYGRNFYSDDIESLRTMYGDFLLFIDNFCVECWRQDYQPPVFAVSKEKNMEAYREYYNSIKKQSEAREYFAKYVHSVAKAFPTKQIIIRPHPVADPRWWYSNFWSYRNVHVIFHHSVEPWIHACSALISMGCTTAIQAVIASKPVIEIKHHNPAGALHGFAAELTNHIVDSPQSLIKLIPQLTAEQVLTTEESKYLNSLWSSNQGALTLNSFSNLLDSITPRSTSEDYSQLFRTLQSYGQSKASTLPISDEKWIIPSLPNIFKKVQKASMILNTDMPNLSKAANCLYLVSPKSF